MTLKEFMTKYMPHKIENKLTKEEQIQKTVEHWFVEIRRELDILPKEKIKRIERETLDKMCNLCYSVNRK